jgi:hypothetical protein
MDQRLQVFQYHQALINRLSSSKRTHAIGSLTIFSLPLRHFLTSKGKLSIVIDETQRRNSNSTKGESIMKPRSALAIVLLLTSLNISVHSQPDSQKPPAVIERNLSGPRLGLTLIPGDNDMGKFLDHEGMNRTVSQFGWHSEFRVTPRGGGPSFLVEFIPLIGGVEYGKLIPNLSLMFGIRMVSGFEFGMGPNVIAFLSRGEAQTALVMAIGKSFDFDGVNIPVNLAYVTNPQGARIGVILGYAIERN